MSWWWCVAKLRTKTKCMGVSRPFPRWVAKHRPWRWLRICPACTLQRLRKYDICQACREHMPLGTWCQAHAKHTPGICQAYVWHVPGWSLAFGRIRLFTCKANAWCGCSWVSRGRPVDCLWNAGGMFVECWWKACGMILECSWDAGMPCRCKACGMLVGCLWKPVWQVLSMSLCFWVFLFGAVRFPFRC